jgi:hypothetical protein
MTQITQIPFETFKNAYPDITVANHTALNILLEQLQLTLVEHECLTDSAGDWSIISPNGNSSHVCNRNILIIGGEKSSFYKQRWRNVHSLDKANMYLLDYYERCTYITKLGVLLTDVWRPGALSRWGQTYELFEKRGIQSVPLLYSGGQITPIRWPWM